MRIVHWRNSGAIPTEIGQLSSLCRLWAQGNKLTGVFKTSIPSTFVEIARLKRYACARFRFVRLVLVRQDTFQVK